MLLPAWLLSRRKYAAAVIFTALALRAAGLKVSAVAPLLRAAGAGPPRPVVGRPRPRRPARGCRGSPPGPGGCGPGCALGLLPLQTRRPGRATAAGSAAGDALAALEAVTAGLRRRFGGLGKLAAHEVAAHLTGGMLLAPPLPALAGNTTLIAMAAVTPS